MRVLAFLAALSAFLVALLSVSSPALAQTTTPIATTLTVANVNALAYVLTAVDGAAVGEVGAENAAWTLQVGQRYRIVNDGKLLFHPFELRSDAEVLLAQGDTEGTFESDADTEFVSDEAGITFTLTPELAKELSSYRCGFHPSMTGVITAQNGL